MAGEHPARQRFSNLVDQLDDGPTTTFDILEVGCDERAHTRILAWLLDPQGSHGLGPSMLDSFLSRTGLSVLGESETAKVTIFDQKSEATELDILIEIGETIICVEIKTQGKLGELQRDRQVECLRGRVKDDDRRFDSWSYIYLASEVDHNPDFVNHRVGWDEVLDLVSDVTNEVDRRRDTIRLEEWHDFARGMLCESKRVTPAAELQLKYPDWVESEGIPIGLDGVRMCRKRILSAYWQWLQDEYPAAANGEDGWGTTRSRVVCGTKYLRLHRITWPPGLRFEVQSTRERMTDGRNHKETHSSYRTHDAHIELTLTYSPAGDREREEMKAKQKRLVNQLSGRSETRLKEGGFVLIHDALPDDCGRDINDYHVYSKQIPIEFSNPNITVDKLASGTECLMELVDTLDDFGETTANAAY